MEKLQTEAQNQPSHQQLLDMIFFKNLLEVMGFIIKSLRRQDSLMEASIT